MKEAIIVLQCSDKEQIATLRFVLHSLGYVWRGSRRSLIEFTPYSLERSAGRSVNIIVYPEDKSVQYNFSKYVGLADIDSINYVLKVVE